MPLFDTFAARASRRESNFSLPANDNVLRDIEERLTLPAGRSGHIPIVWCKEERGPMCLTSHASVTPRPAGSCRLPKLENP